jgi:hypothetical protein
MKPFHGPREPGAQLTGSPPSSHDRLHRVPALELRAHWRANEPPGGTSRALTGHAAVVF